MPQVKLVLSDIDSTILPAGQTQVSPRTRAAFHAAREAGIVIGPASGRGFAQIAPFFANDIACYSTAIATNGLERCTTTACAFVCSRWNAPRSRRPLPRLLTSRGLASLCFDGAHPLLVAGERADLGRSACRPMPLLATRWMRCLWGRLSRRTCYSRALRTCSWAATPSPPRNFVCACRVRCRSWTLIFRFRGISTSCRLAGIRVRLFDACATTCISGSTRWWSLATRATTSPCLRWLTIAVAVANATPEAAAAARWHIGRCEDEAVAAAIEALAVGEWPFEA